MSTDQRFRGGPSIASDLRSGARGQGDEITPGDIGRPLGDGLGHVWDFDVGKRIWLRWYGISLETAEERDERKKVE